MAFLPFPDVSELEAVFHAYDSGSVQKLKAEFDKLKTVTAHVMKSAMDHLALRDRRLSILEYLLNDDRQVLDNHRSPEFQDRLLEVQRDRDPLLFDLVHRSEWKQYYDRCKAQQERDFYIAQHGVSPEIMALRDTLL